MPVLVILHKYLPEKSYLVRLTESMDVRENIRAAEDK